MSILLQRNIDIIPNHVINSSDMFRYIFILIAFLITL